MNATDWIKKNCPGHGSGGTRGYAHLGALKALYEAGVPLDFIVWINFGALVGAAFSVGRNVYEI